MYSQILSTIFLQCDFIQFRLRTFHCSLYALIVDTPAIVSARWAFTTDIEAADMRLIKRDVVIYVFNTQTTANDNGKTTNMILGYVYCTIKRVPVIRIHWLIKFLKVFGKMTSVSSISLENLFPIWPTGVDHTKSIVLWSTFLNIELCKRNEAANVRWLTRIIAVKNASDWNNPRSPYIVI